MIYQSTRNNNLTANSIRAIITGLADDGGLFMLKDFSDKQIDYKSLKGKTTIQIAKKIFSTMFDDFTAQEISQMTEKAYIGKFETDELTPTVKVGDYFVTELFHGPTCAFKDVALSALPQFMTTALKKSGETKDTVILTATSGDTGKAALEGFSDVDGIKIIVFYPQSGVSEIQKAQMVTQEGSNVCVCAVKGNFDDAQTGVKNTFAAFNKSQNKTVNLSSANSINIGRLVPQIVYYFKAYIDLLSRDEIKENEPLNFVVPTGNFGNILAGYFAKCMGLPIGKLVCASNANNVLTDFICTGVYDRRREFFKTVSPSMDILVSSNLERLLYLLCDANADEVASYMNSLNTTGQYTVNEKILAKIKETFIAGYCDDEQTLKTIKEIYTNDNYLCDTHTAVAFNVAKNSNLSGKTVILSTASPYKFPTAVLTALGVTPDKDEFKVMQQLNTLTGVPVPKSLASLKDKKVLHNFITEREDLTDFVFKKADEKIWIK